MAGNPGRYGFLACLERVAVWIPHGGKPVGLPKQSTAGAEVDRQCPALSDAENRERKAFGLTWNDLGEDGPLFFFWTNFLTYFYLFCTGRCFLGEGGGNCFAGELDRQFLLQIP